MRVVLSVRMNDAAARSLSAAGVVGGLPAEMLAPGLRELIAAGIVRRDELLTFARHADQADAAPRGMADLTGWECSVSSFHLDDVVPVRIDLLEDGEPLIGEADQALMLRHGLGFAFQVIRLVADLEEPVPVCCIIGANSTNGTFRFHRARPGETWPLEDLDGYQQEKIIVVDSGPPGLGGPSR